MRKRDKSVSKAWVGRFYDGTIGWCVPEHLAGFERASANAPSGRAYVAPDDEFVLCRITVEVLHDKRGREITRKAKAIGACLPAVTKGGEK